MQSDLSQGAPVYIQILQDIRQRIVSGYWPPGMRIPPVRELSLELGVNPNTAQRSLSELEREGLVFAERTSGRYITTDTQLIQETQSQMAAESTQRFYRQMRALGYSSAQIIQSIQHIISIEEGENGLPDSF